VVLVRSCNCEAAGNSPAYLPPRPYIDETREFYERGGSVLHPTNVVVAIQSTLRRSIFQRSVPMTVSGTRPVEQLD
jgi:hypothetical protein